MPEIYQIDAFTDELFGGNPAAVVPLCEWPDSSLLQSIATENNLAETAFIVSVDGKWEIRWFTPSAEVALCGHATLAAEYVAFTHLKNEESTVSFTTRESGVLKVSRMNNNRLSMSFPAIAVLRLKVLKMLQLLWGENLHHCGKATTLKHSSTTWQSPIQPPMLRASAQRTHALTYSAAEG